MKNKTKHFFHILFWHQDLGAQHQCFGVSDFMDKFYGSKTLLISFRDAPQKIGLKA